MPYLSTADLVADALLLASKLPPDVAGVVGIARSGMIPAATIAVHLHVPLYELDQLVADGRPLGRGIRGPWHEPRGGRLLVTDDVASARGATFRNARRRLAEAGHDLRRFLFGPVYPHEPDHDFDVAGRFVPCPRWLEWQLLTADAARRFMCDIDGVVSRDPPAPETDDPAWAVHYERAAPLYLPRRLPVHSLITCRLAKHREATETWLARFGCRYGRLIMLDQPDVASRARHVQPGRWKGEHYRRSPCTLFVESCPRQAKEIHRLARKAVLCTATRQVFG